MSAAKKERCFSSNGANKLHARTCSQMHSAVQDSMHSMLTCTLQRRSRTCATFSTRKNHLGVVNYVRGERSRRRKLKIRFDEIRLGKILAKSFALRRKCCECIQCNALNHRMIAKDLGLKSVECLVRFRIS